MEPRHSLPEISKTDWLSLYSEIVSKVTLSPSNRLYKRIKNQMELCVKEKTFDRDLLEKDLSLYQAQTQLRQNILQQIITKLNGRDNVFDSQLVNEELAGKMQQALDSAQASDPIADKIKDSAVMKATQSNLTEKSWMNTSSIKDEAISLDRELQGAKEILDQSLKSDEPTAIERAQTILLDLILSNSDMILSNRAIREYLLIKIREIKLDNDYYNLALAKANFANEISFALKEIGVEIDEDVIAGLIANQVHLAKEAIFIDDINAAHGALLLITDFQTSITDQSRLQAIDGEKSKLYASLADSMYATIIDQLLKPSFVFEAIEVADYISLISTTLETYDYAQQLSKETDFGTNLSGSSPKVYELQIFKEALEVIAKDAFVKPFALAEQVIKSAFEKAQQLIADNDESADLILDKLLYYMDALKDGIEPSQLDLMKERYSNLRVQVNKRKSTEEKAPETPINQKRKGMSFFDESDRSNKKNKPLVSSKEEVDSEDDDLLPLSPASS